MFVVRSGGHLSEPSQQTNYDALQRLLQLMLLKQKVQSFFLQFSCISQQTQTSITCNLYAFAQTFNDLTTWLVNDIRESHGDKC